MLEQNVTQKNTIAVNYYHDGLFYGPTVDNRTKIFL